MFAKVPETTNLGTTYLGIDNVVHYSDVLDSSTEVNLDWYETFNNPFNLLTSTDFVADETEAGVYHLNTSDLLNRTVCDALALIVFGDIQQAYSVSEFSVKIEDGEFTSYSGKFADPKFDWYKSEVSFTGAFTGFGEEVFEAPVAVTTSEDTTFDEAMAKLKLGNYTVTSTEDYTSSFSGRSVEVIKGFSDGGDTFLQDLYDTNADMTIAKPIDTYYYVQQEEYDDFMEQYDFSVQQSVKIKDEFFVFSSDREDIKILDNMLPTFNLSSAFFNKDGNTYTLKTSDELPYYVDFGDESVFSPFTSLTIRNLKITITDDSVTFVTDDTYGTITTVSFTNIGTTTVESYDVNLTTEKLTKWEDYFKSDEVVEQALNTIPSEIINIVPTPRVSFGGSVANVTPAYLKVDETTGARSMQIVCLLDSYGDYVDLQYDDLLVLFSSGLTKVGFEFDEENVYEYAFVKEMDVLGKLSTVEISLGGYSDQFIIDYDIVPVEEEIEA